MPSFDVVSELNMHEVVNGVDQANREITTRFDFKGTNSLYELKDNVVTLNTQSEFQLNQMVDILRSKLAKRGIDLICLKEDKPEVAGAKARQVITLRKGIETTLGKKIVQMVKDAKLKVQASIQDEKVRVSGKKKDDLQEAIALLRGTDFDLPLQFNNFRD
ncbi:MAG: YajQ family cyclic di-GMP-binding protein [Deltaproteobacteria bacterium]